MEINIFRIPESTLEDFADANGLIMDVHERALFPIGSSKRFYAHFRHAETRSGERFLSSDSGDGRTPEEAIEDYAPKISGKKLVIDAMNERRREIDVPRLVSKAIVK